MTESQEAESEKLKRNRHEKGVQQGLLALQLLKTREDEFAMRLDILAVRKSSHCIFDKRHQLTMNLHLLSNGWTEETQV